MGGGEGRIPAFPPSPNGALRVGHISGRSFITGVFMQNRFSTRGAVWRWLALVVLAACAGARADQLILNDGTTLEGTVLSQGDKYWVKKTDGTSQIVPKTDVKKLVT